MNLPDCQKIRPYLNQILADAIFTDLPNHYHGKVRENYDLPDGRRVLITTDRISAFDQILTTIPLKGQVLTQTARYWFDQTADICRNHVLAYPDPNVVIGKRLSIMPIEMVVRDYLAGTTGTSILTMYKNGCRTMYGHTFPDGLHANQKLPQTIITPTTKADEGHDMPLSASEIIERGLLTQKQWNEVSSIALALFKRGSALAAKRGLLLADTKYEFGVDETGALILADEIHTPDSSRYWFAESYESCLQEGKRPESFDKDFVRSWVVSRCDPYKDPIPEIPDDVRLHTSAVYVHAYEMITGQAFDWPSLSTPILERVHEAVLRSTKENHAPSGR